MEDVVSEHQTDIILSYEFLADDESLCKSVGRWLFRITELDTEVASVSEQPPESRQVQRGEIMSISLIPAFISVDMG